jgi:hypothetical protein
MDPFCIFKEGSDAFFFCPSPHEKTVTVRPRFCMLLGKEIQVFLCAGNLIVN